MVVFNDCRVVPHTPPKIRMEHNENLSSQPLSQMLDLDAQQRGRGREIKTEKPKKKVMGQQREREREKEQRLNIRKKERQKGNEVKRTQERGRNPSETKTK